MMENGEGWVVRWVGGREGGKKRKQERRGEEGEKCLRPRLQEEIIVLFKSESETRGRKRQTELKKKDQEERERKGGTN